MIFFNKKRDWYVRGLVDEGKLLSIKNDRIDMINKAHDYFYDITQKMSENKLAIELSKHSSRTQGSWMQYLSKRMFVNFEDFSIIYEVIPKMLYEFIDIVENYLLQNEPTMKDFDKPEHYYDYFEARRLLNAMQT